MSGDSRKEFILATAGNYFSLSAKDDNLAENADAPAVNSFLDDGSVSVLAAKMSNSKKVIFANKVGLYKRKKKEKTIIELNLNQSKS